MEKFSEIRYERPDFAAAKKKLKQLTAALKKAPDAASALKIFDDFNTCYAQLATMITVAEIRHDMNTKDEFYDKEKQLLDKKSVLLAPSAKKFYETLLASPYKEDFRKAYGDQFVKDLEVSNRLQNNRILLSMIRENKLVDRYSKEVAACKAEIGGETCNLYGLLKYMQNTDRDIRREAFQKWADFYAGVAPKLDEYYDRLLKLRFGMAKKLGFKDVFEYVYLKRGHYDYTPKDVEAFRNAVRDYVVPACAKLYEQKREKLGLDRLHWYDESLNDPAGNADPHGTPEELVAAASGMYHELSPETDEFFRFMTEHGLFDLVTRPGKHLGGYCTALMSYKAPFIFSNFNGTAADVDVLTHEAGHAFELYLSSRTLPILQMCHSTSDINEIHSMSMEHFAYPYMDKFFGEEADEYRRCHLTDALCSVPYLVAVDEFQHRVYEKPDMTADERYAAWKKIEGIYLPWRDYDGNAFLEKGGFWMQKQHIFMYPFYYVEYALSQICAFQYYIRMKQDRQAAWNDYITLCRAGGSEGYRRLLEIGRLRDPFDPDTIREIVGSVMTALEPGDIL